MEHVARFHAFINKFVPVSDEEFDAVFRPHIQIRQFRKRETISSAGEVERLINFVGQGLVRKYFRTDEDEHITQIAVEGHLVYSQASLNKETPSYYFLEAIEPTTIVSIEHHTLNGIFNSSIKMERLGRLVATEVTVLHERWQMMLFKLNPRERFVEFVQRHPELMQRVPQKFLASLLNIQPETFSRFKHLLKEPPNPSPLNGL